MLHSFETIGEGTTFPIPGFATRNGNVARQRALYTGDFSSLGVLAPDTESHPITLNWFRRVATFFSEFLYSELPQISVLANPRGQAFIDANADAISEVFFHATIDMLRYGTGVVAVDPFDTSRVQAYQLDNFYPVSDVDGRYLGAVIAYSVPGAATDASKRFIVARYPLGGVASLTTHHMQSGTIGAVASRSPILLSNGTPQVINLHNGYATNFQGVSLYDDLESSIGEISRTLTALSATLQKNQRPHLYGPEGLLDIDDNGKANLNSNGSFLGLGEGDTPPAYLQWDSNIVAAKENIEIHRGQVFDLSGLSRLLFSDQAKTGALTGIALKRLMLPFVGKLARIQKINERSIEDALIMLAENGAARGEESITIIPGSLSFEWASNQIFQDEDLQLPNPESTITTAETEGEA